MPIFTENQDTQDAFVHCSHGICLVKSCEGLFRNKNNSLQPVFLKLRIMFPII